MTALAIEISWRCNHSTTWTPQLFMRSSLRSVSSVCPFPSRLHQISISLSAPCLPFRRCQSMMRFMASPSDVTFSPAVVNRMSFLFASSHPFLFSSLILHLDKLFIFPSSLEGSFLSGGHLRNVHELRAPGERDGSEQVNGGYKSGFKSNAKTVEGYNPYQCGVTLKIQLARRQCLLRCHREKSDVTFQPFRRFIYFFVFGRQSRANSEAKLKTPLLTLCKGKIL